MDVTVISRDISRVAVEVRRLGEGRAIVNEMAKEIRRAARPIRPTVKARAVATLPHSGGLGEWVARAGFRVSVKRGPRSAGVSIVGSRKSMRKRTDLAKIDAGSVRAPSWGHRTRASWHTQVVPAGFFTHAVEEHVDDFRDAIVVAVEHAKDKVGLG
jgi:hypothetical protein